LCVDRGIDLAIKTFDHFRRAHPDFELRIVGGPKKGKYYEYCRRLVDELNLTGSVFFDGFVAHANMPQRYSSAVMTLIPTVRREGTSLSALESMACGTPTVSTDVGGLADLPTVKAPAVAEALSEAMTQTLARREEVAFAQEKEVRSVFTINRWSEAWDKVIKQTMAQARKG